MYNPYVISSQGEVLYLKGSKVLNAFVPFEAKTFDDDALLSFSHVYTLTEIQGYFIFTFFVPLRSLKAFFQSGDKWNQSKKGVWHFIANFAKPSRTTFFFPPPPLNFLPPMVFITFLHQRLRDLFRLLLFDELSDPREDVVDAPRGPRETLRIGHLNANTLFTYIYMQIHFPLSRSEMYVRARVCVCAWYVRVRVSWSTSRR